MTHGQPLALGGSKAAPNFPQISLIYAEPVLGHSVQSAGNLRVYRPAARLKSCPKRLAITPTVHYLQVVPHGIQRLHALVGLLFNNK